MLLYSYVNVLILRLCSTDIFSVNE